MVFRYRTRRGRRPKAGKKCPGLSEGNAAGGGRSDLSAVQRSVRCKSALPDAASAGHRKPDHFFSPGKSPIAMQMQPNGCGCIAISGVV